jgi:phosphoribosyl 1,2-cyclic phosphodiesterase
MSLRVQVLASGSTGNAALYTSGGTRLLVDCGLSARRVTHLLRSVGVEPDDLSGILVTHEHTDHVQGLRVFLKKRRIPLFVAPECLENRAFEEIEPGCFEPVRGGVRMQIGDIAVTPFPLPHDARKCFGYVLEAGGVKAVQATDLGTPTALVRERVKDAHCLLLEFNHDVDRLMGGSYPLDVKIRVKGRLGHLSNEQAAGLLSETVNGGTQVVYLMHLSRENNLPELAVLAASEALGDKPVRVEVARPFDPAPPWEG